MLITKNANNHQASVCILNTKSCSTVTLLKNFGHKKEIKRPIGVSDRKHVTGPFRHKDQVLDNLSLHNRFQVLSELQNSKTEVPNVDRSKTCDDKNTSGCTFLNSVQSDIG